MKENYKWISKEQLSQKMKQYQSFDREAAWKKLSKKLEKKSGK
jgi:hypothetical protein